MNTIEDRLRDALRERATHSPIDPDAWEQTVARVRRPVRARPWPRFVIPAAAAAAVIAIVVGAAALTGPRDQHSGSSATRSASPSASAPAIPAPPGPGNYLIQQDAPVSAIVPVKMTIDGQVTWTFVWFGYNKTDRGEGVNLCSVTDGGGFYGGGGCGLTQIPAGQVAVYSEGAGSISMGVSRKQVTSVTALLANGRSADGVIVSGRGFPGKVWLVNYPSSDGAVIVFRNASGAELGHLTRAGSAPAPSRPRSGGIKVFHYAIDPMDPKPGWMTAYLIDGQVAFFTSDNGVAWANRPATGAPAVGVFGGDYTPRQPESDFYGYAHQNVTRVVLRLADGRQYSAQTFAAWPGSGLRLWHFSVPVSLLNHASQARDQMRGYDAAGQVVWQQTLGSAG
jgi:hypothetical protein